MGFSRSGEVVDCLHIALRTVVYSLIMISPSTCRMAGYAREDGRLLFVAGYVRNSVS